ncbi:hypothetical protein [Rudaeicoccus suwonensis]|uniref:Uncharacterized protein n=1 Tax=Rudaeicoccus suwonensis TaxID=657409 RepID=A0A561E9E8_9MICO|nr:hypothetical protein [Rudaeicoccus suwonensis]TWE12244.1 hypothetical protein BKA23_1044 [Rudaeicoccus suwonensis]
MSLVSAVDPDQIAAQIRAVEAVAHELRAGGQRVAGARDLAQAGWSGAAAAQFGRAADSHVAVVEAMAGALDALTAGVHRFHGVVVDLAGRAERIHRERDDLRDSAVILHGRRQVATALGDVVAVAAIDRQLADGADRTARLDRESALLDGELSQAQTRLAVELSNVIPPGLLRQASEVTDCVALAGLVAGSIRMGAGQDARQAAWSRWRASLPDEATGVARAIVRGPERSQPAAGTSLAATALSRFTQAQALPRPPDGPLPGHRMRCGPVRSVVTRPWPRMRTGPVRRVIDDRLDLGITP